VLAGILCLFVNVTLLVPVLPAVAGEAGGSSAAGLATAAFFLPAVAAQLLTPAALRRVDARRLLAGTLVASSVPPERRGAAVGRAGLAAGIPPVFAPAIGVWLLDWSGAGAAFAAAGAAVLLGVPALLADAPGVPAPPRRRLLRALLDPALRRPLTWFGLVSITRGAVISFVPLALLGGGLASAGAYLLVFGTCAYLFRWATGRLADALGTRRLVTPAALASLVGLVAVALDEGPLGVVLGAALFGAGNGALMTTSQLVMLAAARDGGLAVPTAAWNVALDCGFGFGGLLLGLAVAALGEGATFWSPALVMAAVVALVLRRPDGESGSGRPVPPAPR
jgi:predicted MFS family arabinose efflux permease